MMKQNKQKRKVESESEALGDRDRDSEKAGCSSSKRSKSGVSSIESVVIKHKDHHVQQDLCHTRAKYRQGKEFKAVKVYTINDESKHVIIQDIPDIGLENELKNLCQRFGSVEEFRLVNPGEYPPCNPFTATYYVKYATLHLARYAKIRLDNRAFYGGLIHLCYAPEMETIEETRDKLNGRSRYVQMFPIKQARYKKHT